MRAYQDMVFSTAVRLIGSPAQAEDISQDVFLKAYENFERLGEGASPGGWLKTVATNLALNHLTRHRKRWRLFTEVFTDESREEDIEDASAAFAGALQELEEQQRRALIDAALRSLPDHQRVPLVLFHFEEMSYQDIAARLGHSLAKTKTDILRGRLAMAKTLAAGGLGPRTDRSCAPT